MVGKRTKPETGSSASSSHESMLLELIALSKTHRESIENLTLTIEQLQQTITLKDEQISLLNRMLFGKKSERFVSVDSEVKKKRKKDPEKAAEDKAAADALRKKNKETKQNLPEETVAHPVSDEQCHCPICGGTC